MQDTNFNVFHQKDFIKSNVEGLFDLENSLEILSKLVHQKELPNNYDLMFDLRDSVCQLSDMDIYAIAQYMNDNHDTFSGLIAIVIDDIEAINHARFLQSCTQSKKLKVRLFFDYQMAEHWLVKSGTLI